MANNNDLFVSLVSDIRNYTGKDPLHPWIRGIRKMKDSLPTHFLKEKLPRFLQKCAQKFESDPRYRNDLRYLRVWLQLMDFVDDPKGLLRTMEANSIGTKHSLFYQAYALYYEKNKKFEEAEKMYHLGVQNLAEPLDGLQKSYEQFLCRMDSHKNQRIKRTKRIPDEGSHFVKPLVESNHTDVSETLCNARKVIDPFIKKELIENKLHNTVERVSDEPEMFCSDKTVVNFVDTALVGKSDAEDACHHGLVDPTINMKEAMNAINSMFREPIETAPVGKKLQQKYGNLNGGFKVLVDENLDNGSQLADQKKGGFPHLQDSRKGNHQPHQESFSIFIDDDRNDECTVSNGEKDNSDRNDFSNLREGSDLSASHANMFVFPSPKDLPSGSSADLDVERLPQSRFREDTVVCRFVGSTISDEPEVENVCHHGLVDPTINLKEAMEDINNMFGKPMEFVRTKRVKKQDKAPDKKNDFGGFTILPDDECEHQPVKTIPKSSGKSRGGDLFEPTVFTKEAMDDINKMFGMPLDF